MSDKTNKLVSLFPESYAAGETESLLYKLLDTFGAALVQSDEAVRQLLRSHWVDYAAGPALDGLGSIFGVERRQLRDDTQETDDAFRQRLKSIVRLFTGGGTPSAVIGAVRSALGLPFDLAQLNLPPEVDGLRKDIEELIFLEEFSPAGERLRGTAVAGTGQLNLALEIPGVRGTRPAIAWTFSTASKCPLSVELKGTGLGVESKGQLAISSGKTLTLTADATGRLNAVLGLTDVTSQFRNLDGTSPAILPEVPETAISEWIFRAHGAQFDDSRFNGDEPFDMPGFDVEMNWLRYQFLTFDVHVPYFLEAAVENLRRQHGYEGPLFVFKGLPLERLPDVVDQTRAAGVRGSVQFFLSLLDSHDQREGFALHAAHSLRENAGASDAGLIVSSVNDIPDEHHDAEEQFVIGGVFDISRFDRGHGFVA
jgi:hypothetical protein